MHSVEGSFFLLLHLLLSRCHEQQLLLSRGATVDASAQDQSTPLSFAAEKGHLAIAKLLVDAGAKLESKNDPEEKGGATPLLLAAHNGQLE